MGFKADVLEHYKVDLTDKQMKMFEQYYNLLIDYNKTTNLTTITEKTDAYYKHFYDSLTLIPFIEDGKSICDMGSGAGFPSIPLKIIFPNLRVTIVDSANKRIKFLELLVEELNLTDVTLVHDRVEVYSKANVNQFDYVTARALGRLNLILEMGIPLLKIGGKFLAMKGERGLEELVEAKAAIKTLHTKLVYETNLELPKDYGVRRIYILEKLKHNSNYPRPYPQMLKKPL